MLKGLLFDFVSVTKTEDGCISEIRLNPESEIYAAHFKGMPITPGVCLVQMAVETLSEALATPVFLTGAKDIKFLKPVLPSQIQELRYEMTGTAEDWTVKVLSGDVLYAKMALTFKIS